MDEPKTYRAVCFDLDGTLLPMDIDEFMSAYFKRIAAFMAAHGKDGARFMEALRAGTKEMAAHDSFNHDTNEEAFWRECARVYGADEQEAQELRALSNDFYANDFPHIGDGFTPNPAAARVVQKLRDKGYPLLLTTMPMFPRRAVEHRLEWAGVDPAAFARITSYENSTSVKPKPTYFAENLAAAGARGEDVLMVGNNTMEDMAFLKFGADGYLVTDYLLNPIDADVNAMKHGTMEQFEAWVDALPECANPIKDIEVGTVDPERTAVQLERAGIDSAAMRDANAKADAVANAVAGNHEAGSAGSLKIR